MVQWSVTSGAEKPGLAEVDSTLNEREQPDRARHAHDQPWRYKAERLEGVIVHGPLHEPAPDRATGTE